MTVNFGVRRLGHANVSVRDLDRSVAFFEKTCGFEEVGIEVGTGAGFVSNGNSHHDVGMVEIGRPFKRPRRRGDHRGGLREARSQSPGLGGRQRSRARRRDRARRRRRLHRTTSPSTTPSRTPSTWPILDGVFHEFYADVMDDWRTVFSGRPDPQHLGPLGPQGRDRRVAEPRWQRAPDYQRVDGAPVHPLRTTRAVMVVDDVERSLPFYTGFAGLDVAYMAAGRRLRLPARYGAPTPDLPLRALLQGRTELQIRLPPLLLRDGGRGRGRAGRGRARRAEHPDRRQRSTSSHETELLPARPRRLPGRVLRNPRLRLRSRSRPYARRAQRPFHA